MTRRSQSGGVVWAACVLPVVAAAVTLHLMDRHWWCTCGVIRLWYGNAWGAENSQQLFDPYTFTHITHGVLLYGVATLVGRRWPLAQRALLALSIEAAWEVVENTDLVINRYRTATMALGYYGDSIFNSTGDVLACGVGFLLAASLPVRLSAAAIVALEVGLTWWIRDSLLLNILMLLWPVEAIRQWQLELTAAAKLWAPASHANWISAGSTSFDAHELSGK